jgi:uncharacterized protein YjiS (DUF1127 family)
MNATMTTANSNRSSLAAAGVARLTGVVSELATVERTIGLLATWRQRATDRRQLQKLDDHLLRDIGLSRADVEFEVAKPFWRG